MRKSEDDVHIDRIVDFIEKEAQDRADQIQTQSACDFLRKRNELVQKGKCSINKKFKNERDFIVKGHRQDAMKGLKDAQLSLAAKEQNCLREVREGTIEKLNDFIISDKYIFFLENSIVEALVNINEKKSSLILRKNDVQLFKGIKDKILKRLKNANLKIEISIDEIELDGEGIFGVKSVLGGVVALSEDRKKILDNTVDNRIKAAVKGCETVIRSMIR